MNDLISRQAAIDMLVEDKIQTKIYITSTAERDFEVFNGACDRHAKMLKELPSAQPELPKQFMSDDCISRSELYKKVCEAEKLARERVLDTPSDSPFPNKLNPAYTRYSAQLDERTQFKHMIADERSVQPEQRWIPCSERLPEDLEEVNVTWVNHNPAPYYNFAKDKPLTATAVYYKEKWYWYTSTCMDLLAEYGRNPNQEIDDGIEITAWMPLPEPYKERREE